MAELIEFTYEQLRDFTNDFETQIARSIATIYRGHIHDDSELSQEIVVKEYEMTKDGIQLWEFEKQVVCHHPNTLKLLGFANIDAAKKLFLVYPYCSGGTLENALPNLDWSRTLKILKGMAEGINYLHATKAPPIVHGDLKPANILLDDEYNAIICDFNKAGQPGTPIKSVTSHGYVPRYRPDHNVTASDIYSFGVITLQLLMRRKEPSVRRPDMSFFYIYDEARLKIQSTKHLVHHQFLDLGCSKREAKRITRLALRCIDSSISERPTAREIIEELNQLHHRDPNKQGLLGKFKNIGKWLHH